eukprot:INCI3652.1.p1 GENE.INCI3652.1~~INCI3652.1.p1  ORF type:complete len:1755 (+),score=364.46 INCI3652.1:316-5580(+)
MSASRAKDAQDIKRNLFGGARQLVDESDEGSSTSSDEENLLDSTRFGSAAAISDDKARGQSAAKKGSKRDKRGATSPGSAAKATTEGSKDKKKSAKDTSTKKLKKSRDGGPQSSDESGDTEGEDSKPAEPTKPRKKMTKKQKENHKRAKEKRRKAKEKRRKEVAAKNAKKKEGEPLEEEVSSDTASSSEAETVDEWDTLIVRMGQSVVVSNDLAADVVILPNQWKAEDLTSHQLMRATNAGATGRKKRKQKKDKEGKGEDSDSPSGEDDDEESALEKKRQLLQQADAATKVKQAAQAHLLDQINLRGRVQDGIFTEQFPPTASWARSTADSRWLRECVGDAALMPGPVPLKPKRIGVEFLPQGKELRLDGRLHGLDDNTGLLSMNVRKLNFRSHPSFSLEDYLANHLRLRFKDYQSRFTSPVLHDLAMKIRYFYSTYLSSKSSSDGGGSRVPQRRDKMAALRTLLSLAQEAHEIRTLGKEVYELWKDVKNERLVSGFQLTGVKLTAQRVALYDKRLVDRVATWASRFVDDAVVEAEASDEPQRIESAMALKRRMAKALTQLAASMGAGNATKKDKAAKKKKDKKKERRQSEKDDSVVSDFLFSLIDDDESIAGEISVPPAERRRRQLALAWRVGLHLVVNKKKVTTIGPAKVDWPSFSCDFKSIVAQEAKPTLRADGAGAKASTKPSTVNLRLRKQPDSVELEVWQYSNSSKPIRCIGKFSVVLPGAGQGSIGGRAGGGKGGAGDSSHLSGHSVPELSTVYQFTAATPMTGAEREFLRLPGESKADEGKASDEMDRSQLRENRQGAGSQAWWAAQQFIRGEVVVDTKWQVPVGRGGKSQRGNNAATSFLPPPAASGTSSRYVADDVFFGSERSKGNDVLSIPEFARERDFCRAVLEGPTAPLNPNDPRNSDLIRLENLAIANSQLDFFNVKEFPRHLRLVPPAKAPVDDEGEKSKMSQRHQLLLLRKQKGPTHLVNTQPIPASDLGVTTQMNLLSALDEEQAQKDAMKGDADEIEAIAYASSEDVENRNKLVRSFFDKVRNRVKKLEYVNAVGQTDDVVHEEMLPSFFAPRPGNFSLDDMLAPKRRLKPKRQDRVTDNINVSSCSVFVQIAGAKNIYIRSQAAAVLKSNYSRGGRGISGGGPAVGAIGEYEVDERVCPYVSVTFQTTTQETDPQEGPNPRWGQSFSFEVDGPVDTEFSVDLLRQITDEVHIDLFDHIEKDAELDNRLTSVEAVRLERRYLGSFDIPFQTILANKRIEGVFEVDVPMPLVGYELEPVAPRDADDIEEEEEEARREEAAAAATPKAKKKRKPASTERLTQIRLMITLDPPIAKPIRDLEEPTAISTSATMQKRFVHFARVLEYKLSNQFPVIGELHRNISLTAVTVTGEPAIICQFITPQQPPRSGYATNTSPDDDGDGTIDLAGFPHDSRRALAHYVSLVPFIEDAMIFDGKMDVWTSSSDLLYLRAGDWEEHAVLLCNYFLYLESELGLGSSETYCCLGRAVPDGDVVFVLQRDSKEDPFTVWNPRNGHSYEIGARYSPLQSISVIFSNVNAWVNVGPATDLGEQSFDLSDSSLWFPLQASSKSSGAGADAAAEFEDDEALDDPDALHIVKLPSLQSGNPKYDMKNLSRKLAIDLQAAIHHRVEVCMRNWRKATSRTIFNLDFSKRLGAMLERLEQARLAPDEASAAKLRPSKEELDALGGRSKEIFAVPLHISLVDIMQVERQVKRTQIYTIDDPRVEFAVAAQPFMCALSPT